MICKTWVETDACEPWRSTVNFIGNPFHYLDFVLQTLWNPYTAPCYAII